MDVSGKARRRREKFQDLYLKIIDFTEEIVKIIILDLKIPKISGAFGAKTTQIIREKQGEIPKKIRNSGVFSGFSLDFRIPESGRKFRI